MNPITTEENALLSLDDLAARFADAARALWPESDPVVGFEPPRQLLAGEALARPFQQPHAIGGVDHLEDRFALGLLRTRRIGAVRSAYLDFLEPMIRP
jgi:hypothetical protein